MIDPARLKRAAALVVQLGRNSPRSWRRAESIGPDIGFDGAELEQAVRDAVAAGFIERRADDEGIIILTHAGRAAAAGH